MSLKPLPNEKPAKTSNYKKGKNINISPKFQKHSIYNKNQKSLLDHVDKLFQSVSKKLLNFIKKREKFGIEELNILILDLQKIILKLQRRKLQLSQQKAERLKKKDRNKKPHNFPKTFKISKLS